MCKRLQQTEEEEVEEVLSAVSRPSDEVVIPPCPIDYSEKKKVELIPFNTKDPNLITTLPPSTKVYTLYTYDTEFSADSVEWCPHPPFQHVFVCANYYLRPEESGENKRLGRILLFSIDPKNDLTLHQTLDTAAVLDQKWCQVQVRESILLGVVTSAGSLNIYKLNDEPLELELLHSLTVAPPDKQECLLLSLDWSTGKFESSEPKIICSDSKGKIHKFKLFPDNLSLVRNWQAHQYEAWIAAYYYWDTHIMFTGGDDSLLLKFDERVGTIPVAKNKSHGAGVTCIHSNSEKEYTIATGSYDTYLRLWDIRSMKCPTGEIKMPGTLWRVKWDPFIKQLILAACMIGGVHVVSTINDDIKIAESYYEHKSIAYGADWCYLNESEIMKYPYAGNRIIATCSFYDHLLCVSRACLCPYCTCFGCCSHAK